MYFGPLHVWFIEFNKVLTELRHHCTFVYVFHTEENSNKTFDSLSFKISLLLKSLESVAVLKLSFFPSIIAI